MRALVNPIADFRDDRKGSVAIIFALSVTMLMVAVGLAVDGARVYSHASKVGDALDASAIAAARLFDEDPDPGQQAIATAALDYFDAHVKRIDISNASYGALKVPKFSNGTVELEIDVTVPTLFGGLAGVSDFTFKKQSTVMFSSRTVEVAMALDTTGSMCDDPTGTLPRPCTGRPKIDGLKAAAQDLITELYAENPRPGATRVAMAPYSASVNLGPIFGPMAAHTPSGDNCVVERDGTAAYTNDIAAGNNRMDSYWDITPSRQMDYICPTAEVVPLSDLGNAATKAAFTTKLNALSGSGWTSGHLGAAWAWYAVSSNWASFWPGASQPKPAATNSIKAVVLMTDGLFNTAYKNGGESYPASGDPNDPSGDATLDGTSGYQALRLCEGIRNEGIRIYTVLFSLPTEPGYQKAKTLLETCAAGSNGGSYEAANVTTLRESFREIGRKLTQLRISN